MKHKTINIAEDFAEYPAGRYPEDGPYNGQRFREENIIPALKEHDKITIIVDGIKCYGSSFLEESFGGLVDSGFTAKDLKEKLEVKCEDTTYDHYKDEIWEYIEER